MQQENLNLNQNDFTKLDFTNKVALVTGASRGLGKACAIYLAKLGCEVILMGKNKQRLEAVYDEICEKKYPEPAIMPLDLLRLNPEGAKTLCASIESLYGKLDFLVHSAGSLGQLAPLNNIKPQVWAEAMHLNLNVPFLLTTSLAKLLEKSQNPAVLFPTPPEAINPKANWGVLNTCFAGVLNLAKTFASEWEQNSKIRIHCIMPPMARTAIRINTYPGLSPDTFACPDKIAPYYAYLLSEYGKDYNAKLAILKTVADQ